MNGLIYKDLLIIKKQLLKLLLIIGIFSFIGGNFVVISLFISVNIPFITFSYDDLSKWNKFALMLPFTKKEIYYSKYYLGFISITSVFVVTVLLQYIMSNISDTIIFSMDSYIFTISFVILFQAICFPIIFKYGIEKSRILYIGTFALLGILPTFFGHLDIISFINNLSPYLCLLLSLLATGISMLVSTKIELR